MSYEIRTACPADTPELVKLFNEATQRKIDHGDTAWGAPDWTEKEVDALLSNNSTFVARLDGIIAGTITLGSEDSRNVWDKSPAVYIQKIAGRENHRGIGRILLKSAERIAQEREIDILRLDCDATIDDLCSYYENAGYTKVKVVDGDEVHPIALFEKHI